MQKAKKKENAILKPIPKICHSLESRSTKAAGHYVLTFPYNVQLRPGGDLILMPFPKKTGFFSNVFLKYI